MNKCLRKKQVEKFLIISIIFSNNYNYSTINSSTTAAATITGGETILVESFSWFYLLYIKEKIHELN